MNTTNTIDSFRDAYRFLSNPYFVNVTYNGFTYKSSEYAYQAAKATNKTDHDYIVAATSLKELKRRGRAIKCRTDWNRVRTTIMVEIVYYKFDQNLDLRARLKATGDAILIEGNWWGDTYWGVCRGVGKNMLGKILMIVRNA
ncbi:hypothetical protein LCGC14_1936040 [marine sediment metagenome]|uniref:NADAR domain-containing protein n=1 Tax=marine sediment metagenome TaxID=412755 RepID=A0A0F9FLR4_9ZZZZ